MVLPSCMFRCGPPPTEEFAITKEPRVNERIRVPEVRLVDPEGGQIGIKPIEEARWLADQLGLDLVEVAPDARPPVVRLMDYGKFKYESSVKAREARKHQGNRGEQAGAGRAGPVAAPMQRGDLGDGAQILHGFQL